MTEIIIPVLITLVINGEAVPYADELVNEDAFKPDWKVGAEYGGPCNSPQIWNNPLPDPDKLFNEDGSLGESGKLLYNKVLKATENVEILADRNEIRRVMMNLIGNAVNYTAENGKISVKTSLNGKDFMFSVKDNGIGIARADINKMFRRFSQGTQNRRSVSTGLGLYLSKQIIEAHGGKIWLESVQNKGSEFFFLLLNSAEIKNKV